MKAFEQWLKEIKWDGGTKRKVGGFSSWGNGYRAGLKDGYIRALEYIEDEVQNISFGCDMGEYYDDYCIRVLSQVQDFIKKELKDVDSD